MKRLNALVAAAALAAAGAARAEPASSGFSVGARVGYGIPLGTYADFSGVAEEDFADVVDGAIPIWIDATLRLGGGLEVGPYFQYGYVMLPDGAGEDSADQYRVGAQLNYRLAPAGGFAPWIGAGAGWEWLKDGGDVSGFDLMVQGGADWRVGTNLAVGPFVALTFGRFDVSGADGAFHEWLQVGLKASFDM